MFDKLYRLLDRFLGEPDEVSDPQHSVFGDYDIRGRYPSQINEEFFRRLAAILVQKYGSRTVIIGRDSRQTSLGLAKALADGFLKYGVNVIDVGLSTSPYGSWLARTKRVGTHIVTASHSPPDENGLKLYARDGGAISHGELEDLDDELSRAAIPSPGERPGKLRHEDFKKAYQAHLLKLVGSLGSGHRVAVDYLHGTVGLFLNGILEHKKVSFQTLREDPTGEFPSFGPNPLKARAQQELSHLIGSGRYTCGALFDGDGDRVVFFDEKGSVIQTPHIAALFYEYFFSQKGTHRTIVVPVDFSRIIDDVAEIKKGRVIRSPVGRVNLTPPMRQNRSVFGAESSGHYFFKDFAYQDNAILAFLTLLKIIGQRKTPLSKLVAPYKKYATLSGEDITYVPETELTVLKAVRAAFPGRKVDRTDGITVDYKDWWFNLRRSRTEDFWRLSVEALHEPLAREKLEAIEEIIKNTPKDETDG